MGQEYVLHSFGLGGCMKSLPLIWKFPEEYKKNIITPGAFHTGMNYIGMLTDHECRGSGYAEILIEAGVVTSGCLKSVLRGKSYAKALFCLKTVTEAMEYLLIERFVADENVAITNPSALLNLLQTCDHENLQLALQDKMTLMTIFEQYAAFEDKVETGQLGKTATFWLHVIRHTRLLLMLIYSVKMNSLYDSVAPCTLHCFDNRH